MIIYFTGTGNSRYIAKLLSAQLDDTLTDATAHIKAGEYPKFSSDKPYVFVAPIYAWRMPKVFEKWIRECSFAGNNKAYFIFTCGDGIGSAGEYTQKLCCDIGFSCMGTKKIIMPENYIAMFNAPTEEEAKRIIDTATRRAEKLAGIIIADKPFDKPKYTLLDRMLSGIVNKGFNFSVSAKKFYATDKCVSCGKCVDSCMLNNISLADGKPVWDENCTHCMACICKCPTEAIEYGKHTKGLQRYVCPDDKQ